MGRVIIFSGIALVLFSCRTNKPEVKERPEKRSHYHMQMFEGSKDTDSAYVRIQTFSEHFVASALLPFSVKVEGEISFEVKPEKSGRISFKLPPGNYNFEARTLGSYPIKTPTLFLSKGDSLNINFYMEFQPLH